MNCYWMWELCHCSLTCSSWDRFQELELKIAILASLPLSLSPSLLLSFPSVLIYIARAVVWGMLGQAVCTYRKCLHVALD